MYADTVTWVISEGGVTEAHLILAGVMQGDTLAPYLFIIVIDYIRSVAALSECKDFRFTLQPKRIQSFYVMALKHGLSARRLQNIKMNVIR